MRDEAKGRETGERGALLVVVGVRRDKGVGGRRLRKEGRREDGRGGGVESAGVQGKCSDIISQLKTIA